MKKNLFLTLLLALLSTATTWAGFAPTAGTKYALQETTTGLYLDIQTLGINEPNAYATTNNISLNAKPCIIYFAAGTTDNTKWTMQNANGTYVMQATSRDWNATIGATAYEWTINEPETDIFTIARADGGYVSMDNPVANSPLYCNMSTGLKFKLVEYSDLIRGSYTIKTTEDTYLSIGGGSATGLLADGVYTIQGDANGQRGYMSAGEGYADYPVLSEITLSGYAGNSITAITNGKNWYVSTKVQGTYIYNLGLGKYLVKSSAGNIDFSDTPYAWSIVQNGSYTSIYDNALAKYLSMGCGRTAANRPIAWDTNSNDGGAQHTFTAVADGTTTFATEITAIETVLSAIKTVVFSSTPTNFYVTPSAATWFIEDVTNAGTYVGVGDASAASIANASLWAIGDADVEGYAAIMRADDNTKYLGNTATAVGTAVLTDVTTNCNTWNFTGTYNITTTATESNSKYNFTSGYIAYAGACNKIRFTLTESGAYYQNGAKRLSFESFVLYDANGEAVELATKNITGNNIADFTNMLDGTDNTYTNATWGSTNATDDWFEITLPLKVDLGGAFKFSFVTENTTMNAKAFEIVTSYERPADYTFAIEGAPQDAVVTVTYEGEAVAAGDAIVISTFDEDLMVANEISGYTWSVVVDDENEAIKLVYTVATVVENPDAVTALLNRIGGDGTADKFKIVHDPSMNSRNEVFSINGENGKILIKGTTISAITAGIGWYLQNIAHINIAWNSLNEKTVSGAAYADLSSIPVPTAEETHTSDAMYRYYLNTCAFGYSMTSWTWKRWQQEIDWMALHGVNMPLQLVGLEEVWRTFLTLKDANGNRKYGYTDDEAKAFVAGPAFIAWWAMNNLQGWGGTAAGSKSGGTWEGAGGVQDDAWYTRQKNLATQILTRQRELGMQPVLPGWSGMVPSNFAEQSGYTTRSNGGNWAGDFVRPLLLNVSNTNYAEIAADYYACLKEVMGESQYYSMDPFHEGGGAGTMEDYAAMYEAMEAAKSGSKWVIQQWQWTSTQRYSLTAVPAGRLIVLDLFADGSPAFDSYGGYAPQDAVFCAIPNFGGRSGLMGRLTNLTDNYFSYKAKYATIKGIGAAPESIEQTPVTYDLIFQLPWMGSKPDVAEWVSNYSIARYGIVNAELQEAWSLLRQGPLNYGADGIQGPVEDVWAAVPNLTANNASSWGATISKNWNGTLVAGNTYTKARRQMLIDATYKLLSQKDAISGDIYLSNYYYDLVELGGGVLADYAHDLLLGIDEAKTASNTKLYEARRDAFLQLILDVDAFKGTNLNFRLGKWTQEARDAAAEVTGATTATPDWYEYNNARTIVSTWSSPGTNLNDYSYRSWQGLMKDLYYPRWKYYFDNNCTAGNYNYFAWNWAHGKEHYVGQTAVSDVALTAGQAGHTSSYTREPEGNTVTIAAEVLGKYIIPVTSNSGTYYAYRYLANDLTSVCTVIANAGTTVDLSAYFGNLTGVSITGDFIDGIATDITQVAIIAGATDGSHTGTITLTDGTVLTFAVVINPAYNGYYNINYNGTDPVFVGYSTDISGNSNAAGYKLIDPTSGHIADAVEADKIFYITPSGSGYTLSAQNLWLKSIPSGWHHIYFSDNKSEAGVYLCEDANEAGTFRIYDVNNTAAPYLNDYGNVFGNDATGTASSRFTITQVTTFPITIPANGVLGVCLPFNIVLPEGVTAYDVTKVGDDENGTKVYETTQLAAAGGKIKAGTPVILKGTASTDYTLSITVDNADAVGATAGSVLRGNFIKQSLDVSASVSRYAFADAAFTIITASAELAGNSIYMEIAEAIDGAIVEGTVFTPAEPDPEPAIEVLDGKIYRIKGRLSDGTLHTLYTNGSKNRIKWTADETKTDATTLFVAQKNEDNDKFKFVSALANGIWGQDADLTEEGVELTLSAGTVAGTYMVMGDDNRLFCVDAEDLDFFSGVGTAGATVNTTVTTDFVFEEVTDATVSYTLSMNSTNNWATLYLPYAVEVPDDLVAYYAHTPGNGYVQLRDLGGIVPAYTPVVIGRSVAANALEITTVGYEFTYTTEACSVDYSTLDKVLYGKLIETYLEESGKNCYVILTIGENEGFYWIYKEYDEAGKYIGNTGTHFKCSANKAYMTQSSASGAASYSFHIEGTTGIEDVVEEGSETKAVYDLQGRKITEITSPGVYIIDGKTVIVK